METSIYKGIEITWNKMIRGSLFVATLPTGQVISSSQRPYVKKRINKFLKEGK